MNIAITLAALGRFEEAVTAGRRAMEAGERLASRVDRNLAGLQLARALFSLGRWDEAVATVKAVAPETAPANRGMLLGPPLLVALHRGEHEQGRRVLGEFDRDRADGGAAFESDYRSLREVALVHLSGAGIDAKAVIDRAQSGDYAEWPTWLPLAIDLLAQLRDDDVLRDAATALGRKDVPKTSPMVAAQASRLQALLAVHAHDTAQAASEWTSAIAVVSRAGMLFDEAALRLELFEHLPDHPGAPAGVHRAIETFTRLRAAPWLERARVASEQR